MNVLMPCAGFAKRFPSDVPKYLRSMPDMRPMFAWALDSFKNHPEPIYPYFAIRKEHNETFDAVRLIHEAIPSAKVMVLDHDTNGPAVTVYEMIKHFGVRGAFAVKDCDCAFTTQEWHCNECAVFLGWRETAVGDRSSKSWAETRGGFVTSIVEKERPLDWYCHGCYQFADAADFIYTFDRMQRPSEVFCSHVIRHMLEVGHHFRAIECSQLHDWGTWEKYVSWRQERKVLFIDIDGCVSTCGSPFITNPWSDTTILPSVADKLSQLNAAGCALYLITSRPESERAKTEEMLMNAGISWTRIIYGVSNGPRVLVNDYADSNPYPAASAINTERNSGSWIKQI